MSPFLFAGDPIDQPRGIDPSIATGMPPARDASDEDKGLYTVARFAAQNDHFVGPYKTWTKAINFLMGEQWRTKWDGTSMTWGYERDIPPWHQQPVTNLCYAVYRTALAKLTKQKPTMEVVPKSGDSQDKEAAELSEALLTFLWRYLKKPAKLPTVLGWLLVTSMTYVRVGWDPLGGEPKPRTIPMQRKRVPLGAPDEAPDTEDTENAEGSPAVDTAETTDAKANAYESAPATTDTTETSDASDDMEDVDVAADERGEPYKTDAGAIDYDRAPDLEPPGEICWEVVSPLCVRFNPEATSIDDAYEMFVARLMPKNKAAEHFGVKESDLVGPNDSAEQRALYEDLMSATVGSFPRSWADQTSVWGVSQQNAIGDRILVIEYYHKPVGGFPDGRHWITAGGMKVWPPKDKKQEAAQAEQGVSDADDQATFADGEAPLPFGFWPPLVPCVDTPIPGQPSGISLLSQVVPLNEQLNTLDGKIAEKHVVDTMGGVWFISPEDKGMQITSEPAQVIVSKAMGRRGSAFAPFQAELKALAEPVYREREVLNNKVTVVSGLSALDLSQKPQGSPSGRALLVTQETSDSVLMPTLIAFEAMLEECGRRELVIAQQKYTEERTIAIQGEQGQWLYRSFTGADLRDGHDVRVQVGSSFPWSKAAQWDTKLDVINRVPQLVIRKDGSVDRQALAKILDSGTPGLSAFESEEDDNLVEIQREHAMFEAFDPSTGHNEYPKISFWQDHAVHLQEHYSFMKRDFARFQRWSPAAQEAFKQHMQLTALAVDEGLEKMMGPAGGATGGAPSGAPGAPAGGGGPTLAPDDTGMVGGAAGPEGLTASAPQNSPPTQLTPTDFASANAG